MLTTQKLIVILGNYTNIAQARNVIAGFKAVTVIRSLTPYTLRNVYHFNKNAVYFTEKFSIFTHAESVTAIHDYKQIVIGKRRFVYTVIVLHKRVMKRQIGIVNQFGLRSRFLRKSVQCESGTETIPVRTHMTDYQYFFCLFNFFCQIHPF